MTYDQWKTTDPREYLQDEPTCERCNARETVRENEFGEFICAECEDKEAERAWDRFCDNFYGGADPLTIREQHVKAWEKFK